MPILASPGMVFSEKIMRENETTEFKKTLGQLKEGIISIAAIMNKHGEGALWFGIRDDGDTGHATTVPTGIRHTGHAR